MAERSFSAAERRRLADKGEAMPDGSYPTPDRGALERAFDSYGRETGDKGELRRYLCRRAVKLRSTDLIPPSWEVRREQHADT